MKYQMNLPWKAPSKYKFAWSQLLPTCEIKREKYLSFHLQFKLFHVSISSYSKYRNSIWIFAAHHSFHCYRALTYVLLHNQHSYNVSPFSRIIININKMDSNLFWLYTLPNFVLTRHAIIYNQQFMPLFNHVCHPSNLILKDRICL